MSSGRASQTQPAPVPEVSDLLSVCVEAIGGRPREGQQEMASAVAGAITAGSALLVQAGTGTGKSLAYLVPAIRHAVTTGDKVVVSTATLALQSQIVGRDLPRLVDGLRASLGRELTFGMVKGRSNYVCRQKLSGGIPEDDQDTLLDLPALPGTVLTSGPTTALGREVVRLREWAENTDTGDRDDLVPGVSDRAWRQVSVSALECLGGQRCPAATECFSEKVRAEARQVDVVVTNHALLAIDTFEGRAILPEHVALIVDEAHELADRVTGAVTDQLTVGTIEAAASKARRHAGVEIAALLDAAESLERALTATPEGRFTALPEALSHSLALVRDGARTALTDLKQVAPARGQANSDAAGALQVVRAGLSEVFDIAERLLAEDANDVSWLTVSEGRGGQRRTLSVAPLSVSGKLKNRLYENRAVVLTSATLTTGGEFDAVARSVGLGQEGSPRHEALDVGSPFDYPRQAILYVARSLPPPGRVPSEQMLTELAELIEASDGRTLGLFSSRAAAQIAAESMRERLDFPILCQGDDSMPALVKAFAADPNTCLFGTLSLWQGVDVPGANCQLVVIDRIPFPRPDDPLLSARAEAVSRAGGNGFMSVSVTHAALRLAQGAGRLIRQVDDRGVVAVLDSRLATARYGSYLAASLPPMWRTTDGSVVRAALRRLAGE